MSRKICARLAPARAPAIAVKGPTGCPWGGSRARRRRARLRPQLRFRHAFRDANFALMSSVDGNGRELREDAMMSTVELSRHRTIPTVPRPQGRLTRPLAGPGWVIMTLACSLLSASRRGT
jgi:hypothetical protein